MEDNSKQPISLDDQLKLAKTLLIHYETLHPMIELQLTRYTVACCNIALPGIAKVDAGSKMVIFEIKTEKKYKLPTDKPPKPDNLIPIKKSKITDKSYKEQKNIAKMNLEDWTKKLMWGEATSVRIVIDGTEV